MQKRIEGIHQFREDVFRSRQGLYERLAEGQRSETLFITCSDSRIDPNLLSQSEPGELSILRNHPAVASRLSGRPALPRPGLQDRDRRGVRL